MDRTKKEILAFLAALVLFLGGAIAYRIITAEEKLPEPLVAHEVDPKTGTITFSTQEDHHMVDIILWNGDNWWTDHPLYDETIQEIYFPDDQTRSATFSLLDIPQGKKQYLTLIIGISAQLNEQISFEIHRQSNGELVVTVKDLGVSQDFRYTLH